MPSGTTADLETIDFAPDADTLAQTLDALAAPTSGGAVDAATRREALALFASLPAPGSRPRRGWRYDYDRFAYDDLVWTTGRRPQHGCRWSAARSRSRIPICRRSPSITAGGLVSHRCDAARKFDPWRRARRGASVRGRTPSASRPRRRLAARDRRLAQRSFLPRCPRRFRIAGAFVYVPDGVVLDAPIQLVFANTASTR